MEKRPVFIYAISDVPNLSFTFCHRPQLLFGKRMQACSAVLTILHKVEEGRNKKMWRKAASLLPFLHPVNFSKFEHSSQEAASSFSI